MVCDSNIPIIQAQNASDFINEHFYFFDPEKRRQGRFVFSFGLEKQTMLCTANELYDGSKKDKDTMWYLAKRQVPLLGPKARQDIMMYFLEKSLAEN